MPLPLVCLHSFATRCLDWWDSYLQPYPHFAFSSIVPHIHSIAPVRVEPAWHRNLRARRHRARVLVKAAKRGDTVDPIRLVAARVLLAAHHSTRGSNGDTMGKNKNGPNQHDWQCPNKSCRCKPNGEELWNWGRIDECHQCHAPKPPNPKLYSQTPAGKARLAAGGAKVGAAAGSNGGGGGGGNKQCSTQSRASSREG